MGIGAEHVAQRRKLHAQRRFLDHHARPHAVEQFILGEEVPGTIDERAEQVERARPQNDRQAILQQPPFVELELERSETVAFNGMDRTHCADLLLSHMSDPAARATGCGSPSVRLL